MISVGTVYMSTPEAPVAEILKDLIEMTKGVQHPLRGLFLRYFLAQRTHKFLPSDLANGELKSVFIDYILANFTEMNRLWIRLQHEGHSREREKRYKERQELQILIVSNLVRLSELDLNLDDESKILSNVLEQVVKCRDTLAQEYLLDVVIQLFDIKPHLEPLLEAITHLTEYTNVKIVLLALFEKLRDQYDEKLFVTLWDSISKLVVVRKELTLSDVIDLCTGVATLSLRNYENLDSILSFVHDKVDELKSTQETLNATDSIVDLLSLIANESNPLNLKNFKPVLNLLPVKQQKKIIIDFLNELIANQDNLEDVDSVFGILSAIVEPIDDKSEKVTSGIAKLSINEDEAGPLSPSTLAIQSNLAKVVHLLSPGLKTLESAKLELQKSIRSITYPALAYKALLSIHNQSENDTKEVLKFVNSLAADVDSPNKSFNIFVSAAQAADQAQFPEQSYDLYVSAMTVYEESIMDYEALCVLVNSLYYIKTIPTEELDTLSRKCVVYGNKLLRKQDKCRSLLHASHLIVRVDKGKLKDTLEKALKVAESSTDQTAEGEMVLDILDKSLWYFERGIVPSEFVNSLITNLKTKTDKKEGEVATRFTKTLEFIRKQKDAKYKDLKL